MLDTNGKVLKKKYSIVIPRLSFDIPTESFSEILKEIIHDDELIFINHNYDMGSRVFSDGFHATGLYKHKEDCYIYDSNIMWGEFKFTEDILYEYIKAQLLEEPLSFEVYSFDESDYQYPNQNEVLTKLSKNLSEIDLINAARMTSMNGNLESLKFFLDKGLDPTIENSRLLTIAAHHNNIDIIRELLARKVDPNQANIAGGVAIMYAAMRGFVELAEFLLDDERTEVDKKDNLGKTALRYAVEKEQVEMIKVLIDRGVNPCIKDINGKTPYMVALEGDFSDEILEILNTCKE